MDHGYQVLEPERYRLHFLMHDGEVTWCGGVGGNQLEQAIEPAGSPTIDVCLMCALRESKEFFENDGQSQ